MGRRAVLGAALVLPIAACGKAGSGSGSDPGPPSPSRTVDLSAGFGELETRFGARVGVFGVSMGSGATVAYRSDERFAYCSTFKAIAAAAVLAKNPLEYLDTRVMFSRDAIRSISPVTQDRVDTGMTVGELCDAAVRFSDGTAGNLLLDQIGGTAGFNAYLRSLGDDVGKMVNYEPELNNVAPGDDSDTTTPRAIADNFRALLLGSALPEDRRAKLSDWLERSLTGAKRIKAGAPQGVTVRSKTGTGNYGRANDVGVVTRPDGATWVLAIMTDRVRDGYDSQPSEDLIAESARKVFAALP
ncbi:class A beta-lactamase [Nocardia sp. NPDC056100]|uniref:class A beta-lactamase n=1 Tax=Nocardia sp. NPDC056100 TaxID=3345712 RepID=UPI0035E1F2E6